MTGKNQFLALLFYFTLGLFPVHATTNIGIAFFQPPFVLSPAQGFEVDLIHLICQRIKESCNLIPMDPDKFFISLRNKKIDLAVGVVITQARLERGYIFSLPYILAQGQFLTLKSSNVITITKSSKLTVGLVKAEDNGSVFYDYLLENYPNFSFAQYDDMEDLITNLTNGKIDAAFTYKETNSYWLQNGGNQFQTVGKPVIIGGGSAIMALPKNSALIKRINQSLTNLENDQAYLNLYTIYFVK